MGGAMSFRTGRVFRLQPIGWITGDRMGRLLNLVTPLHRATTRDYMARMMDEKVHCMLKAKEYEGDYWDGDRRYGYGGYRYIEGPLGPGGPGLINLHGVKGKVRIIAYGFGKGHRVAEV